MAKKDTWKSLLGDTCILVLCDKKNEKKKKIDVCIIQMYNLKLMLYLLKHCYKLH